MRLLLDTNILIPLEPTGPKEVEATTTTAIDLVRVAQEGAHQIVVHPASLEDLANDKNEERRALRAALVRKYPSLDYPPDVAVLPAAVASAKLGTNDWIDNNLLAAVYADAVEYLITEDGPLLRKAARIGLQDRVLTAADALGMLNTLLKRIPAAPPAVEHRPAHALDLSDPIFDTFRSEYPPVGSSPGFDDWIRKCRLEGRDTWIITGPEGGYGGLAIVKPEGPEGVGFSGSRPLKLCSFKVAEEHRGRHFGELLLKTLFDFCADNRFTHLYVETYPHHEELTLLLDDFGFQRADRITARGELTLVKTFVPHADAESLPLLAYHKRYGPPAVRIENGHCMLVPIRPEFHRMLFPDAGPEMPLPGSVGAYGNSIRKAYLSNAAMRSISPGDALAFYRSEDLQAVTVIGVVERIVVSKDPTEIAKEVGRRTVYSFEQIEELCSRGKVLALLFRQDRILRQRIPKHELLAHGVIRGHPPQTVQRAHTEGLDWLRARIEE